MCRCPKLLCFFQLSCSFVWRPPEVSADSLLCCFAGEGGISEGDSPGIVLIKQDLFLNSTADYILEF